jgi:hypothetical protein
MSDDLEQRGVGDGHAEDFEAALSALLARLCIISPDVLIEDEPCDIPQKIPLAA